MLRVPRTWQAVTLLFCLLLALPAQRAAAQQSAEPLVLVTWNIGIGDADVSAIASTIASFSDVDLWAIQEMADSNAFMDALEAGAEAGENANFIAVRGDSGLDIPLLTIYNADRLEMVDQFEVDHINTTGNARAPLVLHLRERASGVEFLLVNNHLYRTREEQRDRQATLLNEWAATQTLPIIAAGDHNFDYDVPDGPSSADAGFANMTAGGVWEWARPAVLVPTQCSGALPCTYDDILDFVFMAGAAQDWLLFSEIIVRPGDFPDDETKSDHRPVMAVFELPSSAPAPAPATPRASASPTAAAPTLSASAMQAARNANLRAGPGTTYAVVGNVTQGDALTITGANPAGDWYQLSSGAWIAAFLVTGSPAAAPVASPPAVATAMPVTRASGAVIPLEVSTATPAPRPAAAAGTLAVVDLDKRAEYAVIRNTGGAPVDLAGWVLLSEKGAQACPLSGVLDPGEQLVVSAMGDVAGFNCGFGSNIWNNSESDAALLIDPGGNIVSRY